MSSAIVRDALTDDDGSGTTGSVLNNAWLTQLYNRIDAALLTTPQGIVTTSTKVQQIAFAATQSASSDPNTLDDYEEFDWTPVIGGAGGTSGQTYGVAVGKGVKKGKEVTAFGYVALVTSKGTITGNVQIQGFPFAAENTGNQNSPLSIGYWENLLVAKVFLGGFMAPNTTAATVYGLGAAGTSVAALVTADIANTTGFVFRITYRAAA